MRFEDEFGVKAPADTVYEALLDVERVAPCLPGAQVLERTGDDSYKVGIKVRLGPMSMQYRGQVEILEKDPEGRRAVMSVRAKETRGQGMADATVQMSLVGNGELTTGKIEADVQLSGKAAAMGQGVIQDVSASLVKSFADNLAEMLSPAAATPAGEAPPEGAAAVTAAETPAAPSADESLSVGAIAGSVVKGRLRDPRFVLVALLLLVVVVVWRRARA